MDTKNKLTLNGREITFGDERNLLELIRKNGIEIPTFCYHSELSIYGACRLCIVDIAGKGIQASCSIKPEPGMVVKTDTRELRDMRKIYVRIFLTPRPYLTGWLPKRTRTANGSSRFFSAI